MKGSSDSNGDPRWVQIVQKATNDADAVAKVFGGPDIVDLLLRVAQGFLEVLAVDRVRVSQAPTGLYQIPASQPASQPQTYSTDCLNPARCLGRAVSRQQASKQANAGSEAESVITRYNRAA